MAAPSALSLTQLLALFAECPEQWRTPANLLVEIPASRATLSRRLREGVATNVLESRGVGPHRAYRIRTGTTASAAEQFATSQGDLVIFQPEVGNPVEVRLEGETLWLSQDQIAHLFGKERSVVVKHLRNIFAEGELDEKAVCANFAHTADDGKTYQIKNFNLEAIISVGYRVNSKRGTQFRQWATRVLRDHLNRGWTLNKDRFEKNAAELEAAMAVGAGRILTTPAG